jgi:hypothetical protein
MSEGDVKDQELRHESAAQKATDRERCFSDAAHEHDDKHWLSAHATR